MVKQSLIAGCRISLDFAAQRGEKLGPMSLTYLASRFILPTALFCLSLIPAQARFITPDEVITSGALKEPVAKIMKDPKDKDAAAAIKKAADGGDKDAQFAYAFISQQAMGGLEAPKDKPMALIDEAKALYKKSADAGQMAAQNNLGLLKIASGEDLKSSMAIIEDAANAGYGKARITLAQIYIEGVGTEKNPDVAMRWLQRAQESEPNEASYLIGAILEAQGDQAGALNNLTKAAENKYAAAMLHLGNKFLNGSGIQQDLEKAREWFTKAQEAGNVSAKVSLGLIHEVQAANEKDKAKQTDGYKKALDFYKQAAEDKLPDAYNKLGYFCENGLGLGKDEAKAAEWYQKGAEAGLPISMYNWAILNEEGRGVKSKNEAEAVKWLYNAAVAGFAPSQLALGERYRGGKSGVNKDPVAAMSWIEKAATGGNVGAQMELANMLETGEAGFANLETAAKLYLDAAKKGQPVAMYQIADMLEKGRGLKVDLPQAYGFLAAAAKVSAGNEGVAKQVNEKLDALKKRMSAEELKKGGEFLKQLIGDAASAAAPSGPTKEEPKKPATAEPKKPAKPAPR